MTDQPVFVVGEELQALEAGGFETEAEFQELLARHPRILDFGTLSDGQPMRLMLVAREMGVATSADGGPAYWLDHLFVDGDGVPTLVEVKRATDTRIRREVVGQMLDYAANGSQYWPATTLQRAFEETCTLDGQDITQAYAQLIGPERAPEDFWAGVEERLAAGQMRLLFVADRIPVELRAVVEFLNRQMRHTDVYAVELTQYRGAGELKVLVPRVYGEVATAAKTPAGQRRPVWTRTAVEEALENGCTMEVRQVVQDLVEHATRRGKLVGGNATYPSLNLHYRVPGRSVPLPVGTLSLREPGVDERLAFNFGAITNHLGLEVTTVFAQALPTVGGLEEQVAAEQETGFKGWKEVPLAVLAAEPGAVEQIQTAIDKLLDAQDAVPEHGI
ncbi:hypothetical protein AB0J38_21950 [Streptomyces sp. NPDC050095]|uniref:hypothetical protein n=1 Tax=unclassified Streptomyces TaxID=2593676 RepID=UPI00343A777B